MELKIKTFVIFDTHFGHKNIIRLANRPFSDVKEMDEALIYNWNSVVDHDDLVIMGGDFAWSNASDYFVRLNGMKTLIKGNHDSMSTLSLPWLNKVDRMNIPKEMYGRKVILDHYPIQDWDDRYKGSIHIHGHTHRELIETYWNRRCASVECINYTPVDLGILVEEMVAKRELS